MKQNVTDVTNNNDIMSISALPFVKLHISYIYFLICFT